VASGELTNLPFLASIGSKKFPVILSTGMGTLGEVQKAIETLKDTGADEIILLHCTTEYPAPADETNLRAIANMKQAFGLPVGFSDHTSGNEAAIAATALGAVVIEKHLTLDRSLPGPDHAASMEPREFAAMVAAVRKTATMLGTGIKIASPSERANRALVRRGLVAAVDLKAGQITSGRNLAIKRPATGISPELLPQALNRRLLKDIAADEPLTWQHLGEVVSFEP
jgi:N-acetylneuraminate synthase/N,N'-diacetyllegionaminate synthase